MPLAHALWRAAESDALSEHRWRHPVLDLGCGDGAFACTIFEQPLEAGLDLSLRQLRRASDKRCYRHLCVASGAALPLADQSFATVFSNCVLEHIPDIAIILGEVARVLQPGGELVFTVPSEHFRSLLFYARALRRLGFVSGGMAYGRLIDRVFEHHNCDAPAVWEQRLVEVGMTLISHRYIVPARAVALWDLLLPLAALQQLSWRKLPTLGLLGQEMIGPRVAGALEQMLAIRGDCGGGLVMVARKGASCAAL